MIRWSYVLPRLTVLLVALAVVHFGIPPLLRWMLVRSLESTTGTEVEVANVWTSLAHGEARIGGLRVARDNSSETNVLQFESASLALDLNALAHQRCVIDRARVHGLKFGTPRTVATSNARRKEITVPDVSDLARRGHEQVQQWLRQVTAMLERRVEDEFESIRLARQLAQRWPEDYRQLQEQARRLRGSALQLRQAFTELPSRADTMKQIVELRRRWPEVVQLREEIAALHRRATELANQIQRDRESIDSALQRDRENLRAKMRLAQLDGQLLGNYLLDAEVRRWWVQLKPWLESARWLTDAPDVNKIGNRGRIVQYDTATAQPSFLIRAADLDGQLWLAGHQVDFVGQARDLTFPGRYGAARYKRPAQLKLVTRGPFTAQLHTQFDTVGGTPRQQIALRCDDLPLPARRWGDLESVHVSVAPSTVRIQARLMTTRRRLDGRLRVTQQGIQLAVTAAADSTHAPMLKPLTEAAGNIDRFDLWVDLTGTLAAPQWQLRSDLGAQLQEQLQLAARQVVRDQADRLMAEADQRLSAELARVQQQLAPRQAALQQQLRAGTRVLSGLAEPVAARLKPLGNLLRRF